MCPSLQRLSQAGKVGIIGTRTSETNDAINRFLSSPVAQLLVLAALLLVGRRNTDRSPRLALTPHLFPLFPASGSVNPELPRFILRQFTTVKPLYKDAFRTPYTILIEEVSL